jgi:hypothetical protein
LQLLLPLFEEARRKAGFCFSGATKTPAVQGDLFLRRARAKSLDPRLRGDDEQEQQHKQTKKAPAGAGAFAFQLCPKAPQTIRA